MSTRRPLISLIIGIFLTLLISGVVAASTRLAPAVVSPTLTPPAVNEPPQPLPAPDPGLTNARLQAVREGKWPAQVASAMGNIVPDQHGPQRNDPAEGIPDHAYSPFDEKANREYPCPPGGCEFEPGQVLVKLEPGVGVRPQGLQAQGMLTADAALNAALAAQEVVALEPLFPQATAPELGAMVTTPDGELRPQPDLTRWQRATLRSRDKDIYAIMAALEAVPGIAWTEPNYLRKPVGEVDRSGFQVPSSGPQPAANVLAPTAFNDPLYAQQWHLAAVNAPQAWDWLAAQDPPLPPGGDRDIVVAVIDTGVDYTHPDLAANMWVNAAELNGNPGQDDDGNGYVDDIYGADTVSGDGDPADDHGHGTHVAGIIAAQADNGIGGVGVAYNVQVMAIKAAQYSGVLSSSDIAEGIYYAVEQGADIINMSFGGYSRSQIEEDALSLAFGQAVLVAAAGNDTRPNLPCPCPVGRDMYPAAYIWVLGVMASTSDGGRAPFSNYDCVPFDSHEYELMTPGVDIWSALPQEQYAAWDGTSMAAPIVSGIAVMARTKWADKNVYSSRFIMGQIAENTSGGVADAYAALTAAPKPKLSYLEHWLFDTAAQDSSNDDDGTVDAGEVVDLAIVIRNHWGKADPVSVVLEPWAKDASQPDPYVTMEIDTVDYGAVSSFSIDDNGLNYDNNDLITGVQHPFRFRVATNTPNDHVIPFRLTMTAGNGFAPSDPPLIFTSYFYLTVQRGRDLPRIISEDMVLTKDNLWLVPYATLLEAGVTVTVTEGTQIQFFSADPSSPYSEDMKPMLQVEGTLHVLGTADKPVEVFPGLNYAAYPIVIYQMEGGHVDLHHTKIINPYVGTNRNLYTGQVGFGGEPLEIIDHGHFSQAIYDCIRGGQYYWNPPNWGCDLAPAVEADVIQNSVFQSLGYQGAYSPFVVTQSIDYSLFDANFMDFQTANAMGNVLLKNYKLYEPQWDNRWYWVSKASAGTIVHPPTFMRAVFPVEYDGKTYVAIPKSWRYRDRTYLSLAEKMAAYLGGHVVTVNDTLENDFLITYHETFNSPDFQTYFDNTYPDMNCGEEECWKLFATSFFIGLNDEKREGEYTWTSGEPITFTNWNEHQPNNDHPDYDFVYMGGGGVWATDAWTWGPIVLELPGSVSDFDLSAARTQLLESGAFSNLRDNAILNVWWDPDVDHWLRFDIANDSDYMIGRSHRRYINNNYWGTTSTDLIYGGENGQPPGAIDDVADDFNKSRYVYQPILTSPPESAYPFVVDVILSTTVDPDASSVGAELVTFTVTFNRDMDTAIQPAVSFGPDVPYTDFTIPGDWVDPRTWQGTFNINPITGDGYQFMNVTGAVAADDPWLVTGDDSERFRFEIITSGTEAMNLQATGGEGYVDLQWTQDDFDLLAGYNILRSTTMTGTEYSRINSSIIPPDQRAFRDSNVQPGQTYYYKFTIVKSDMSETDPSNIAEGTAIDTIKPVLSHTPLTEAAPGLPLTISAEVTDNVVVKGVTLYSRALGASTYTSKVMVKTTGNRYSATLEGAKVASPGVEYYIEATDGISMVRSGRAEYPHQIVVVDRPVITTVTPNHGPAEGGTAITLVGSNFKAGASVTVGGAVCSDVVVVSASQITCETPAHFPAAVDVAVTNPDGQSGSKLRGFTYQSTTVSLSLPDTGGGQHALVQVPINAANVQGLAAASLTVSFDSSVIRAVTARTGTLTPGWSLTSNTATPGQVRLSMASSGGTVSGSGVLASIEFEVVGSPGQSSTLSLSNISLNGGAMPVETANGSFSVDVVYSVSGHINFWNGGVVSGTLLTLEGDRLYAGQSGSDGAYTVSGAAAGDYTLTPSKSDGINGISAYDASLVLQHDAGLIALSGPAATAANVDKSTVIDSMDAFYILQKSVDLITLPFPGAGVVWDFDPANRIYTGLSSDQSAQDFTAILLGDVSGNWTAPASAQAVSPSPAEAARLQVIAGWPDANGMVEIAFRLSPGSASIHAIDLALIYDPARATLVDTASPLAHEGLLVMMNQQEQGLVTAAMAGALPLQAPADILRLHFQVRDPAFHLQVQSALLDEGAAPLRIEPGHQPTNAMYLPLITH